MNILKCALALIYLSTFALQLKTQELYMAEIGAGGNHLFNTNGVNYQFQWQNLWGVPVYVRGLKVSVGRTYGVRADIPVSFFKYDAASGWRPLEFVGWDNYTEPVSMQAGNWETWFPSGLYVTLNPGEALMVSFGAGGFNVQEWWEQVQTSSGVVIMHSNADAMTVTNPNHVYRVNAYFHYTLSR